jgi:PadR family transcriptional regulator PadR
LAYLQQLLKGLIDPIILSIIDRLPMYGYQIVKEVERRTAGYLKLKGGTIYPSLLRLEKSGLVISKWKQVTKGRGRRYYQITEEGRRFLTSRSTEWHNLCAVVSRLMQGANSDDDKGLAMKEMALPGDNSARAAPEGLKS